MPGGAGERVVVVGAGILGLAVARALAATGREVIVLDKESSPATHQTGHNSGVVHAGIYYTPGSLKATLCRRGVQLLKEYCGDRGLEYREIGKVVVARDESELERLAELERRAEANGVPDVRRLDAAGLREIEPHVRGVAALHSPTTAIVDFVAVTLSYAADVEAHDGAVSLGQEVQAIRQEKGGAVVTTTAGDEIRCDRIVICAGLQSDVLARAAGDSADPVIIPFRGEYYRLLPERRGLVHGLVYPVPDPAYPFLGVHFTPRIAGQVDIGPNAVLALAREGYRKRDARARDVWGILRSRGARHLFRQHWRAGVREMRGSLSKRAYVAEARTYVPDLRASDVIRAPAGVRAQAVDPDGSLVDDFRINHVGVVTAVRNAPSPAATSSLAIAEHVVASVLAQER
ncbi:MAG TPA: L-2-hydroxyglutarate oxidase [Nocardioides sp.]|jgi:L-2-hydroxyglutarate oxidase LhgO|nr:L-2-hydroxyglutarate oxidase [Nocardioides sp.]